jgi:hypothetical protein
VNCRGEEWWKIRKKKSPDGDMVIVEGVLLEYCFDKPFELR